MFVDKVLVCRDCGQEFTFTAGEQKFYQARGLQHEPTRCSDCRAARKQSRYNYRGPQEMYRAVCAACGAECEVPFQPRGDRPVYCRECYTKRRAEAERKWS